MDQAVDVQVRRQSIGHLVNTLDRSFSWMVPRLEGSQGSQSLTPAAHTFTMQHSLSLFPDPPAKVTAPANILTKTHFFL